MKILVEIDLPFEPNDIYKPNSGWFNYPGFITIPTEHLELVMNDERTKGLVNFKYLGQVHEEILRP